MTGTTTYSDKELFKLPAEGDEKAFTELFYRYVPKLHTFLFKLTKSEALASEIVQDIFLKVWQKRASLAEVEQPSAWIYRITSNLTINHFRRQELETKIITIAVRKPLTNADLYFKHLMGCELKHFSDN